MLFECLTGSALFRGQQKWEIEDKIRNNDFPITEDIDGDAKDLMRKLLRKCPFKRLGAGEEGSKYSLEELKNHPFFKGYSFETVCSEVPPLSKEERKIYYEKYFKNNDYTHYELGEENIDVSSIHAEIPLKSSPLKLKHAKLEVDRLRQYPTGPVRLIKNLSDNNKLIAKKDYKMRLLDFRSTR